MICWEKTKKKFVAQPDALEYVNLHQYRRICECEKARNTCDFQNWQNNNVVTKIVFTKQNVHTTSKKLPTSSSEKRPVFEICDMVPKILYRFWKHQKNLSLFSLYPRNSILIQVSLPFFFYLGFESFPLPRNVESEKNDFCAGKEETIRFI